MKKQKGYTLVELVITLAILVILISFALGPIRNMLLRNQVSNQVNLLQLDLTFARSEAINSSYPVVVLPNESWTDGWEIFVDINGNDQKDEGEDTVRTTSFENDTLSLTDSQDGLPVIFTRMGSLKGSEERSLSVTHSELDHSKTIFMTVAGSVSIRKVPNE